MSTVAEKAQSGSAKNLGVLATALFLTAWSSILPAEAQELVFLIRHAERDFSSHDGELLAAGRERALEWTDVFSDVDLDAIVTSEMLRTQQTAAPIAESLGIAPRVYSRNDIAGLVDLLRSEYADDRVLLVSHSSSIPEIIRALGSDEFISIPRSDYDDLFVVDLNEDGSATVARLNVN